MRLRAANGLAGTLVTRRALPPASDRRRPLASPPDRRLAAQRRTAIEVLVDVVSAIGKETALRSRG